MQAAGSSETSTRLPEFQRAVIFYLNGRDQCSFLRASLHFFRHSFTSALLPLLSLIPTPWCTVLLEKLTGFQLVKKFPTFHGTRRFITALTSVRHLSLSWASPIQSIYPHPTSWRSILILSTHLRLGLSLIQHIQIR